MLRRSGDTGLPMTREPVRGLMDATSKAGSSWVGDCAGTRTGRITVIVTTEAMAIVRRTKGIATTVPIAKDRARGFGSADQERRPSRSQQR
jgi:hypothetical protein